MDWEKEDNVVKSRQFEPSERTLSEINSIKERIETSA